MLEADDSEDVDLDAVELSAFDLKRRVELYGSIEAFTDTDEIMRVASMLDCSEDRADIQRTYVQCALQFHPDKLSVAITDSWKKLTRNEFEDAYKKLQGYVDSVKRIWKSWAAPCTPEKVAPTAAPTFQRHAWQKTRRSRRAGWQVHQRHTKSFRR